MMARPKSSKACSIGSREQVVHGTRTSPGHMLQEFFHCSSDIWANVVVLQPNVVSIKFFLGVEAEVFQNVQLHEGVDISIRSHQ